MKIIVVCIGEKPFSCEKDGCKKAFTTNYSLKVHKKHHEKEMFIDSVFFT
jgi:hypothetical protein